MSRKTTVAYLATFRKMTEVCSFQSLKVIMTDFEAPLRNAVSETFPAGCNFHYDKV